MISIRESHTKLFKLRISRKTGCGVNDLAQKLTVPFQSSEYDRLIIKNSCGVDSALGFS